MPVLDRKRRYFRKQTCGENGKMLHRKNIATHLQQFVVDAKNINQQNCDEFTYHTFSNGVNERRTQFGFGKQNI
jgi:hypothetical protein